MVEKNIGSKPVVEEEKEVKRRCHCNFCPYCQRLNQPKYHPGNFHLKKNAKPAPVEKKVAPPKQVKPKILYRITPASDAFHEITRPFAFPPELPDTSIDFDKLPHLASIRSQH